jgi:L,D-transpeptidase YcbB
MYGNPMATTTLRSSWLILLAGVSMLGCAVPNSDTGVEENRPASEVEVGWEERSTEGQPGGDSVSGEMGQDLDRNGHDPLPLEPEIRSRVEAGAQGGALRAGGEGLRSGSTLYRFYRERGYAPAWLDQGDVSFEARTLLAQIGGAHADGLDPDDYHRAALDSLIPLVGRGDVPEDELRQQADIEFLLTDAFMQLGAHLAHGRLNPTTVEPNWSASRNGVDMGEVLGDALDGPGVREALDQLRPLSGHYQVMREALARYRQIADAGGWPELPDGPTLDPGDRNEQVAVLRERLAVTGHLPSGQNLAGDPEFYDPVLEEAVQTFQRIHGLAEDGRVGPATRRALNLSARDRYRQLLVNLERWRWLPQDLGDHYILVNIPAYQAMVVDGDEEVFRLRTIVGLTYRQTPVFSARMTYLALAPYWNVPPGIAARDQFPRLREDPGYVAQQHMVLFEQGTNRVVDPHSVDWSGMSGAEFNRRYRLRQEPGPHNALGRVKFMFPNRHNVYLHDTPGQELFDRVTRTFSSGCIRVERAMELAEHLLRDAPDWTADRIRQVVAQGRERSVTLPDPYMVHIQYWTAWVEADGEVHFRDDIYERDPRVLAALAAQPWLEDA